LRLAIIRHDYLRRFRPFSARILLRENKTLKIMARRLRFSPLHVGEILLDLGSEGLQFVASKKLGPLARPADLRALRSGGQAEAALRDADMARFWELNQMALKTANRAASTGLPAHQEFY